MRRGFGSIARALLGCLVAVSIGVVPSPAAGACAGPSGGGEWTSYGGDDEGTRAQPLEDQISVENVADLQTEWVFTVAGAAGTGRISASPLVSGGCVYVWTTSGYIFALNADDGGLVWSKRYGGVDPASPAIYDGKIYVSQNGNSFTGREGIHAVALDAATGNEVWVSPNVVTGSTTATGAVVANGYVIVGTGQGEFAANNTGGYALIDADTGAVVAHNTVVPPEQGAIGYPGCSIWAHAAYDPATKHAYVGTGQPGLWTAAVQESERCNAIVKIDVDPERSTFGKIVGQRKGTPDDPPYIDVDFGGGGATVADDGTGNKIAVQIQKSGWIHAAYTETMTAAWSVLLSPVANTGTTIGNYTGQATDGQSIFTVGAWPGQAFSLDSTTGAINWVTPIISPVATNPMAYANGVVYYSDEKGVLNALDSETGIPLLMHPIASDNSGCTRNQSGGVAVARHLVYAVCGGVVAAYGL